MRPASSQMPRFFGSSDEIEKGKTSFRLPTYHEGDGWMKKRRKAFFQLLKVPTLPTTITLLVMPRGKPKNAEYAGGPIPFKFSSIPQPVPYLNAKNVSSTYGKTDSQSWWTKRDEWDQRDTKRKRTWLEAGTDEPMADDLKGKGKEVSLRTNAPVGGDIGHERPGVFN
jgi:hypothetical protein